MATIVNFPSSGGTKDINWSIGTCSMEGTKALSFDVTYAVQPTTPWIALTDLYPSLNRLNINVSGCTAPDCTQDRTATINVYLGRDANTRQLCSSKSITVNQSSLVCNCGSITSIEFYNIDKNGCAANTVVGRYELVQGCNYTDMVFTSTGVNVEATSSGTIITKTAVPANSSYDPITIATISWSYNGTPCDSLPLYQEGQFCSCEAILSSFYLNQMIGSGGTSGEITVASADTRGCGYISATTSSSLFLNGIRVVPESDSKYLLKGSIGQIPSGSMEETALISVSFKDKREGSTFANCGTIQVTQYNTSFPCPITAQITSYTGHNDPLNPAGEFRPYTDIIYSYYIESLNSRGYKIFFYNDDPADDSWLHLNCTNGCVPVATSIYDYYGYNLQIGADKNNSGSDRKSDVYCKILSQSGEVCASPFFVDTFVQAAYSCCAEIEVMEWPNTISKPSGGTGTMYFNSCVTNIKINGNSTSGTGYTLKDSNGNNAIFFQSYYDSYQDIYTLNMTSFSNPYADDVRNFTYTVTYVTTDGNCNITNTFYQRPICSCNYIMNNVLRPSDLFSYAVTPINQEGSIASNSGCWDHSYYDTLARLNGESSVSLGCNWDDFNVQTVDINGNPKTYQGFGISVSEIHESDDFLALNYSMSSNFVNQTVYFRLTLFGCDYGLYKASFVGYDCGGGGEPTYDCESARWSIEQQDTSSVAPLVNGIYQVPKTGATITIAIVGGSAPTTDFGYVVNSTQGQYFNSMTISGNYAIVNVKSNTSGIAQDFSCTVRGQFMGADCYTKSFYFHQTAN